MPSDSYLSDLYFDGDWLVLRQPFDHVARDNGATAAAVAWAEAQPMDRPLRIADLGAGIGSNLRFLAPRLARQQSWTLVDHDGDLLAIAASGEAVHSAKGGKVEVKTICSDLATGCDDRTIATADLVTAAALIDLVAADWLDALIDLCILRRSAVLLALTYDGRMDWTPALPDDGLIKELFDKHQRRNKGFGPALGPEASDHAAARLATRGYRTVIADSAWQLGETDSKLLIKIIDGCADAAEQVAPRSIERIAAWRRRRSDAVEAGQTRLILGHKDLFAEPV